MRLSVRGMALVCALFAACGPADGDLPMSPHRTAPLVTPAAADTAAPGAALVARTAGATAPGASFVVQTVHGPVEGFDDGVTHTWLGIPFAAPPVGTKRWRAPVDPAPWSVVRPAKEFALPCGQLTTGGELQGGEDCLYVNVWKPRSSSTSPRPIMVWVHGGGNELGATSDFLYGGAHIAADHDVIVVSLAYRLGPLGWLRHDALQTGDPLADSGNFGLLDIMKALRWVRDNGAAFGGDASNVTVFGESAGGMNIWAMLLSPLAGDLFDRAIVMSGYPQHISIDRAKETATGVLEALVINDGLATAETAEAFVASQDEAWIEAYFQGRTTLELLTAAADSSIPMTEFYAIQDGVVLPPDIDAALAAGDFHHVPMLTGSMRDEMKAFVFPLWLMNRVTFDTLMTRLYGDASSQLEALYPRVSYTPRTYYNQFSDILDNQLELFAGVYMPQLAALEAPVWVYHFHYDALKRPFDYAIGAGHGLELPFVFANMRQSFYPRSTEAERQALTATVQGYFTCFAKTGDPSACSSTLRPWPPFTVDGPDRYQRMILDAQSRVEPLASVEVDRVNFWLEYHGWNALPRMEY